jgi:hypothetical protein
MSRCRPGRDQWQRGQARWLGGMDKIQQAIFEVAGPMCLATNAAEPDLVFPTWPSLASLSALAAGLARSVGEAE